MTSKEYFYKHFDKRYGSNYFQDSDFICELREAYPNLDHTLDHLVKSHQNQKEIKFGNDLLANEIIRNILSTNTRILDDRTDIFLGKLRNPKPNCYTLKQNNELSGLLICYTSGISECSYLMAKLFNINRLMEMPNKSLEIDNFLNGYRSRLINDFAYRLVFLDDNQRFASLFDDNDLETMFPALFIEEVSKFAVMIDKFFISHEIAHHLVNAGESIFTKLIDKIVDLTFSETIPANEIGEVYADIGGVILHLGYDNIFDIELQESKIINSLNSKVQIDFKITSAMTYAAFLLGILSKEDCWYDFRKRNTVISKSMYLYDASCMLKNTIGYTNNLLALHERYDFIKKSK